MTLIYKNNVKNTTLSLHYLYQLGSSFFSFFMLETFNTKTKKMG